MKHAWFLIILLLGLSVSCSKTQKPSDDCDSLSNSSDPFGSEKYDCPTGDPNNDDIVFSGNSFVLGDIEAGFEFFRSYKVTNTGTAKIFDFEVVSSGTEIIANDCPDRFNPGMSCNVQIKVEETLAQNNKQASLGIRDRSGKLSKDVPLSYNIKASYPEEVIYTTSDVDFKTQKVTFGPLKDRFNNLISENWSFQTSRKVSSQNLSPYLQDFVVKSSDSNGKVEVYVQTDRLEQEQEVDSADLAFFSSKVYMNGESVREQFSITFLNNRPTINPTEQNYIVNEDSLQNPLSLLRGADNKDRALTYQLLTAPSNGVISNCLSLNNFITLVTCSYTPKANFAGVDTFTYKVFNGASSSFQIATVKITVVNLNDAPILITGKSVNVNEKQANAITLIEAYDPDGDSLNYDIGTQPTKGVLSCNGLNCTYTPSANQLGTDSFTYRARDPFNLTSNYVTITLNIKQVNEAPLLGGSFSVNTTEDQVVSFVVPSATDPENDVLLYKIKTPPAKGVLSGCLQSNALLSCTYTPNKNVDSADTFSYVAVDSSGLESDPKIVSITINQVNDAPEFSTLYQEVQTLVNNNVSFILLSASDPESNPITYELVTPPAQGILQDCLSTSTNLTCRYQPPTNVNNSEFTFTYRARDNQGAPSELRTVKIVIKATNNLPVPASNLSLSGPEDQVLNFTLNQGSDTETLSNFLRYRMGTSNAQHGLVSKCMDLVGSDSAYDITCEYKPNKDFSGSDIFSYYLVDGAGNQSSETTVSITITPENDGPSFDPSILALSFNEDEPVNFTLPLALDPESNPISYRIKTGAGPQHGALNPTCLTSAGVTNACVFTPVLDYFGKDDLIIEAVDPQGSAGEFKISMTVSPVNDAPVLVASASVRQVLEDIPSNLLMIAASDVDNSTYELSYELITSPTKGLLSNCLKINNTPGLACVYTPFSNMTGIDSFSYRSFDGNKYSNIISLHLNISPVNNLPFFERSFLGPFRVERGSNFSFNLEAAKDIENETLTYQVVTAPQKGILSSCFSANPLSCIYTADEEASGMDSFVYRAKDSVNNSFNNVQVNFLVDDKRIERISKLNFTGISEASQKQIISTDKEIYTLGSNLFFNAAIANNNYTTNVLLRKDSAGVLTQLGNGSIKSKTTILKDELYVFEELSTGNSVKIYNQKGGVVSVPYAQGFNIFYPIGFNDNIYAGSNSATLFKLNLLKLNTSNYQYLEPVANLAKLGITNSTGSVETIGVYRDELYFSYPNQNGLRKIAKIDKLDQVTKIFDQNGINGHAYLGDFFYYKNQSNTIEKIYFFAGESSSSKRLYSLNIKVPSGALEEVSSSLSAQSNLVSPQVYEANGENPVIVYRNSVTKKILILDPSFNSLVESPESTVKEVVVSKDRTKIAIINESGLTRVSTGSILNTLTEVPGLSVEWAFSFELDRLILKRSGSNELYVLDSQNALIPVSIPSGMSLEKNLSILPDRLFFYSPRSVATGVVHDLYEFKSTVTYELEKGSANQLDSLVSGPASSTYALVAGKEPQNGDISGCFGISSSTLDNTCVYTPNEGFLGEDSFTYKITYPNSTVVNILVSLSIKNKNPVLESQPQLKTFASLTNLGGAVEDYILINEELFFSVNQSSGSVLYRFNKAEGLRVITSNSAGFNSFESKSNYFYFVDKSPSNKIYQYDLNAKTIQEVFKDSQQGNSVQIKDIVVLDEGLFALAKDYGFPPVARLIKVNLDNFSFAVLPLPANYENGAFVKIRESFIVETQVQFSYFNKISSTFVETKSLNESISVGRSTVRDDKYIIFQTKRSSGGNQISTFHAYDFDKKEVILSQPLSYGGYTVESAIAPVLHPGASPTLIVETKSINPNGGSAIDLLRPGQILGDSRNLFFSGPHSYNEQVKITGNSIMTISHNQDWSLVSFKRYGEVELNYVLNSNTTPLSLKYFTDPDLDSLTYEISDFPNYGRLENCLGLNSSSNNDLECDYVHTDTQSSAVFDSFKYRAFDGFEYGIELTIPLNIKNSAPFFSNAAGISFTTSPNVPVSVTIPPAQDLDGNQIYYIVTQSPVKGTLTGCITPSGSLASSTRFCTYTASIGSSGMDSFKVRAFDGLGYSEELVAEITISNDPAPVFLGGTVKDFVPNTVTSYKVFLERAVDPNGNPLTYSILTNPAHGTLSNCLIIESNRLVCTYTPNNNNQRIEDTFTYQASNGTFSSAPKTVKIKVIASEISGAMGSFSLTQDGPVLSKNGLNNLSALANLPGYNWNANTKTLILPANVDYHFKSFAVEHGTKLEFKPFTSIGESDVIHGWTRIYSQSTCLNDGLIKASGGQTNNGVAFLVTVLAVDNETISYNLPGYPMSVYGGTGGGSSQTQRFPDVYIGGNPTQFKAGSGQLGVGMTGAEAQGGFRGKDGLSVFFKCLDSFAGDGTIDVSGVGGSMGQDGAVGGKNDSNMVSFGGGGAGGGGNGGHGGALRIKTEAYDFTGDLLTLGGLGGEGGEGGLPNFTYNSPFQAERGIDGSLGIDGISATCRYSPLSSSYLSCP